MKLALYSDLLFHRFPWRHPLCMRTEEKSRDRDCYIINAIQTNRYFTHVGVKRIFDTGALLHV
jgi:hypothetical protein